MSSPDGPIRPASTVMVVRDASGGLEVFTLRRVVEMAFAGGMTAFPGGGIDPTDNDPGVPWFGPAPAWWADRWAIGEDDARARVVAAVRELFEETGILLAGSDGPPSRQELELREADRAAVAAHLLGFPELLGRLGYPLRADLLRPWARWITPEGQPRRYDTYFFVAALPDGLSARALTTEAVDGAWARPSDLLAAADSGAIGMLPPTRAMITDLARAPDVATLLATPRSVTPVTPVVVSRDGEVTVIVDGREVARGPALGALRSAPGTVGTAFPAPGTVGTAFPAPGTLGAAFPAPGTLGTAFPAPGTVGTAFPAPGTVPPPSGALRLTPWDSGSAEAATWRNEAS